MTLLESTRKLLDSATRSGLTLWEIAKQSNGTVKFEWLRKFAEEDGVKNPTVTRVQALHDCLKKLKHKSAA